MVNNIIAHSSQENFENNYTIQVNNNDTTVFLKIISFVVSFLGEVNHQ